MGKTVTFLLALTVLAGGIDAADDYPILVYPCGRAKR